MINLIQKNQDFVDKERCHETMILEQNGGAHQAIEDQVTSVETTGPSIIKDGGITSQTEIYSLVDMIRKSPSVKSDLNRKKEENLTLKASETSLLMVGLNRTAHSVDVRTITSFPTGKKGRSGTQGACPTSNTVRDSTNDAKILVAGALDRSMASKMPRENQEVRTNHERFVSLRHSAHSSQHPHNSILTLSHNSPDGNIMTTQPQLEYSSLSQSPGFGDFLHLRRSRSIAIKKNAQLPPSADFESCQDEESSEKMYDWATWRMYNRIVDHRRNQKGFVPEPISLPAIHSKAFANTRSAHAVLGPADRLSPDCPHDGEVFQLEI